MFLFRSSFHIHYALEQSTLHIANNGRILSDKFSTSFIFVNILWLDNFPRSTEQIVPEQKYIHFGKTFRTILQIN